MPLKRSRSHQYGFSNIDFRSKQDKTSLYLFQPWISPKNIGTMGYSNYILPEEEKENFFKISKNLNNLKNIYSGIPDPKTYESCKFYEKKK